MKIWLLSLLVSTSILGVGFFFDTTADRGSAGDFPASLVCGCLVTIILFMPCYGIAANLRYRLHWPEWTRLPMVGLMWLLVWSGFYLFMSRAGSGLNSWGDVFHATGQFWAASLAYGVPSTLLSYVYRQRAAF